MEVEKVVVIPVFRKCMDCGWEQFEPESVKIGEDGRRTSLGFTKCPQCQGAHLAIIGYKDRRMK